MSKDEYLTKDYNMNAEEVAEVLRYNVQHVRILARTGMLPALKRGRVWMFCEEQLWDFLERNTENEVDEYLKKMNKLQNKLGKGTDEERSDR